MAPNRYKHPLMELRQAREAEPNRQTLRQVNVGMGTKLYVGNLNFRTTDLSLGDAFRAMGLSPVSVQVIQDRETGRSRGFAFVEMATGEDAAAALTAMQGRDVEGRLLNVTEARERDRTAPSMGPRTGPRIGPPVNQGNRPPPGPRPSFGGGGGGDPSFRASRPPQDFSRPSFPPRHMEMQPHPDLVDPAANEGRNRDSRRERREHRGNKQQERDDDDDY